MAGQQQELDANEPATAHKLEQARARGSVVRSADLTFAAVLVAALGCVYGLGERTLAELGSAMGHELALAARGELAPAAMRALAGALAARAMLAVAPIVAVLWVAAALAGALQARGVFSSTPVTPDFARLDPAAALKKVFSLRSLQELGRSVFKLALGVAVMAGWASHRLGELVRLPGLAAPALARAAIGLVGSALAVLAGLALVFALLDWTLNRSEHLRRLRMSRREIRDETKEREGDPRIRARLRELRLEWLRRARQIARVRSADVVVTNPTHYAVALEYRAGAMPAPLITARGAGELARRMRAEAHRRGVPVVEHVPLARALFALEETQLLVPEEHFESVARILRWVYAARRPRTERAR